MRYRAKEGSTAGAARDNSNTIEGVSSCRGYAYASTQAPSPLGPTGGIAR
jgi:hypothetical protein